MGKTWLVRNFADQKNKQLIELNFERDVGLQKLFSPNDPKRILIELEAALNKRISPESCLLFIDEVQAAPELLAKLRWFAEEMPALPVIAAGSLLEFVLSDHSFSMPVGRISYLHLEPLSFEEMILASDQGVLYDYLQNYQLTDEISDPLHEKLNALLREYIVIGGMPAAVSHWVKHRSLSDVQRIQQDLLATYRDDFGRYHGRLSIDRLDEVFHAIPRFLGRKFVFSKVNPNLNSASLKKAIWLLNKARVCHQVISSAGNGVPLAAEINEKFFKMIYLDIGLVCASLGVSFSQIQVLEDFVFSNEGGLAEQFVGQQLRTINKPYIEPTLYYWLREAKSSNAEVDYLMQQENKVIPIEVKAGTSGSLKSLHQFVSLKHLKFGMRISMAKPQLAQLKVHDYTGMLIQYDLLSLPFYLLGQVPRLLRSMG